MTPAKKRKYVGRLLRLMVWDKTVGRCWYCGHEMHWGSESLTRKPHIDHKIPVCQGGEDSFDNLIYSCGKCNMLKGGRTIDEFRVKAKEEALRMFEGRMEYMSYADAIWLNMDADMLSVSIERIREAFKGMNVAFWGELREGEPDHYVI